MENENALWGRVYPLLDGKPLYGGKPGMWGWGVREGRQFARYSSAVMKDRFGRRHHYCFNARLNGDLVEIDVAKLFEKEGFTTGFGQQKTTLLGVLMVDELDLDATAKRIAETIRVHLRERELEQNR